jgi:MoaA/NifB/PqqE/SkfB family radical SAM enzyme
MLKQRDESAQICDRIIDEGKNTFPSDVVIESTTYCNLNCVMCSNDKITRKRGRLSWSLYIKVVEEIAERAKNTTRLWLCYYGEPLLRVDLVDMVTFAKSKGIKNVVINSNMNLMSKEKAEGLVKAGLNTVFVGLDACTPEIYEQIRCGGNYEKTVENILIYKKALDEYGTENQQIIIQFIELEQNRHQRQEIVDRWSKLGITVKVRPSVTWQGTNNTEAKNEEGDRQPCHWLMNVLPVTWDGECVFCGCDYNGQVSCGNLNDMTIYDVWNTAKKKDRLIQLYHEWDKLPIFCRNCGDWNGAYAKYE